MNLFTRPNGAQYDETSIIRIERKLDALASDIRLLIDAMTRPHIEAGFQEAAKELPEIVVPSSVANDEYTEGIFATRKPNQRVASAMSLVEKRIDAMGGRDIVKKKFRAQLLSVYFTIPCIQHSFYANVRFRDRTIKTKKGNAKEFTVYILNKTECLQVMDMLSNLLGVDFRARYDVGAK